MHIFLRYMSDEKFKKILQKKLHKKGYMLNIYELEECDLIIPSGVKYEMLKSALDEYYEEKWNTPRSILIKKLKITVIEAVRKHTNGPPYVKYATYLSGEFNHSYPYLSSLFSQTNGSTLEQYIITQRIEVVKKMLVQDGLGLSEIAWRMGYCSVPHLSNQFKKITGSTPTSYRTAAAQAARPYGILCKTCEQTWIRLIEDGGEEGLTFHKS